MERTWRGWTFLTFVTAIVLVRASPVYLHDRADEAVLADPVSINQWNGKAQVKGAYLISRISIQTLNSACEEFTSSLDVSSQVMKVLNDSQLIDSNQYQVQKFSFISLKLEKSFANTLKYVESLSLCTNIKDITEKYDAFTGILDVVWKLLNNWRTGEIRTSPLILSPTDETHFSIINSLQQFRPPKTQHFPGLLVGFAVGVGALGANLLGNVFGYDNDEQIQTLNENINKVNDKLLVTNKRIDVLAKNISTAITDVKQILEKIIDVGYKKEVYDGIMFNLDQISEEVSNMEFTFQFSELVITMLESGIINPDLIEVRTFQQIISEGIATFTNLEFPMVINQYTMNDALKLIEVKKVGHNQFVMVTPLFHATNYIIYDMIAHPIAIKSERLIPEFRNVIMIGNSSYIITTKENIQTINNKTHLLKNIEPMWSNQTLSCEWASFNKNLTQMLNLCNYKRVGKQNGTIMTELRDTRLIYLSEKTTVEMDCPDKKVRDNLIGMNKLPLHCDVSTNQVFWPARQVKEINIDTLVDDKDTFDITALPIVNVTNYDQVSDNLKALIAELPEDESFTFAFKDISLNEVKTYSVIAYGTLSVIVVIHSIVIGLLVLFKVRKWWNRRNLSTRRKVLGRLEAKRASLRRMRDSIELRGRRWKNRGRRFTTQSQRSQNSPTLSLKSLTSHDRRRVSNSPQSRNTRETTDAGTNTEPHVPTDRLNRARPLAKIPAIPRYP